MPVYATKPSSIFRNRKVESSGLRRIISLRVHCFRQKKPLGKWCLVNQLFDLSRSSSVKQIQGRKEICIPLRTDIVGHMVEYRESPKIPDCNKVSLYKSGHCGYLAVDAAMSMKTGYSPSGCTAVTTKESKRHSTPHINYRHVMSPQGETSSSHTKRESILAMALALTGIRVQVVRLKIEVEAILSVFLCLQICDIGIRNTELHESSELENKRNQVLLDLARMVFEKQSTIGQIVHRIMIYMQSFIQVERCQVLLLDENTKVDEDSNFRHHSILCMPIRNESKCIVGVSQLINKLSGIPFTKKDEHIF
ncbi:dual 3',5'-cyclic-AMP and -GMP phosphodiesterase 11 [Caerostris extrusa]|uniref:Dual 3',5'-cyclic-AMP and -GMP phosphodiesterase 11 n=1 Tax=Caerostris extrusa TaxID=172846 RepID=A0AAV4SET2_CAEEX|nr:dual 3',5'-cyclic-AMP and -GMP phosphodiesterase 11 [Caerostris extrusa]